jgi:hypothetical protein
VGTREGYDASDEGDDGRCDTSTTWPRCGSVVSAPGFYGILPAEDSAVCSHGRQSAGNGRER